MPRTPCRASRCPHLVSRTDKGFCDHHAHLRFGWARHQARHGTASERGYGKAWRALREQVMERDGYVCQVCLTDDRYTPATEVDHIINKASGGTDALDNLQAICRECHKIKTRAESRKGRGG